MRRSPTFSDPTDPIDPAGTEFIMEDAADAERTAALIDGDSWVRDGDFFVPKQVALKSDLGISSVSEDETPALGGDLDTLGYKITASDGELILENTQNMISIIANPPINISTSSVLNLSASVLNSSYATAEVNIDTSTITANFYKVSASNYLEFTSLNNLFLNSTESTYIYSEASVYLDAVDDLFLDTGGSAYISSDEDMFVSASDLMVIGADRVFISSPELRLNGLKIPNSDGTESQALTTDGAGNLIFSNTVPTIVVTELPEVTDPNTLYIIKAVT